MLTGTLVVVESDNASTLVFLNRRTVKNCEALKWLKLFFKPCTHDFYVSARHVPVHENLTADAISRILQTAECEEKCKSYLKFDFFKRSLPDRYFFSYPSRSSLQDLDEITPLRNGTGLMENTRESMASVFLGLCAVRPDSSPGLSGHGMFVRSSPIGMTEIFLDSQLHLQFGFSTQSEQF